MGPTVRVQNNRLSPHSRPQTAAAFRLFIAADGLPDKPPHVGGGAAAGLDVGRVAATPQQLMQFLAT